MSAAINAANRFRVVTAQEFVTGKPDPRSGPIASAEEAERMFAAMTAAAPLPAGWLDIETNARPSRHIAEILANPATVRWLKRNELERGVIAVMSGPRGSYKSALSLEWIGHVVVRLREPVLWCTAEGSGTQRRFAAWLQENAPDVDAKLLPGAGLKLISDELATMAQEFGKPAALCCFDTYSKYSGGLDENSNSEVKAFVGGLDAAVRRKFDCSVLLVAHTGLSDKSRARGASALEADTDAAYVVSFERGVVSMSRERFKDSPTLAPLLFTPQIVDLGYKDADGEAVTGIVLKPMSPATLPHAAAKPQELRGGNQKRAYDAVKELSPTGQPVEVADVIDLALSRKSRDGKTETPRQERDARRHMQEALDAVALTGRVQIAGEYVSLAGVVAADAAAFDK